VVRRTLNVGLLLFGVAVTALAGKQVAGMGWPFRHADAGLATPEVDRSWCHTIGYTSPITAGLALAARPDAGVVGPLQVLLAEAVTGISATLRSAGPVMPLLPEAPLDARANAMVDWCRGFLGGLGLAGVGTGGRLAPVASDLLHDFAEIASTQLECEDGEAPLAELLDFIGGAVARLHAALAPGKQ